MPEQALYITRPDQLKYFSSRFSRIYFGAEFCQRLIPGPNEVMKVVRFAARRHAAFTLMTPYCTDEGMARLQGLFVLLARKKVDCEIVVNDWGTLQLLSRHFPGLTPVLGRLLTKQKRAPNLGRIIAGRIKPLFTLVKDRPGLRCLVYPRTVTEGMRQYYRGSNACSVGELQQFLISRGIHRIELDNTLQGVLLSLPEKGLSASLYHPFVYITTTFYCPTAGCDDASRQNLKIKPCRRQCRRYSFRLCHKSFPKEIFLQGNTKFYRNDRLPSGDLKKHGIDRIVFMPEIPV